VFTSTIKKTKVLVNTLLYIKEYRIVFTSTFVFLIGSEFSCDLGSGTYKLNLKN
jgi:hypothetical protein